MALPAKKIQAEESVESRIARLEATTEHIQSDVKELRQDVKDIRQDLKGLNEKLDALQKEILKSFESMRIGRVLDRVWTLLAMGALLGVIARGFKWI